MALPWFRVDCHIGSHDKVLDLLSSPASEATKYKALWSYVCSIGYAVDHSTDGRIPTSALPFIHGNKKTAELLVTYRLWQPVTAGWMIHKFAERQELAVVSEMKAEAYRARAEKANCRRWHGETCWDNKKGCRRVA